MFKGSTSTKRVCSPVVPNSGVQSKVSVLLAPIARLVMFCVSMVFPLSFSLTTMLVAVASPLFRTVTLICCGIPV